MEIRIFQKGFNFSQDGPGNRLVYHLQGCNLRCPWCSNPEGLVSGSGAAYTVDEIVDEVKRSEMMFFDGGGVTLTGGEATVQFEAVKELLCRLHESGVNTCIETNGICARLPELFPYLDLLIADVKHYDPVKHKQVTGLSNEMTLENIKIALAQGQKTALRIPLIGGFNAEEEDAKQFAALFGGLKSEGDFTVELLPYHEYGKDKYGALGVDYKMTEQAKVGGERLIKFKEILENSGITVIKT